MTDKEKEVLKGIARKTKANPHIKWARNTVIGTAKGVAIAAAANTVADATRGALKKRLRHH